MNWIQINGALELGLIYSLVSIGVFLSFRVLKFPDLSVDGTFPLGAATCAALITQGVSPFLATALAVLAGCFFGWITALLSSGLKMLNLLAGILTMSALYSINLRVMGNRPNLSLLGEPTVFSVLDSFGFSQTGSLGVLVIIIAAVCGILIWLLSTQMGLAVRATGANERVAQAQGVRPARMIGIGLAISNGFVALAGALFAQLYGFADVTLGVGTIIIGLASVILGEAIFFHRTATQAVIGCVLGAILYRLLIAFALNLGDSGLQASDLNLMTSLLVVAAMGLPHLKKLLNSESPPTGGNKQQVTH